MWVAAELQTPARMQRHDAAGEAFPLHPRKAGVADHRPIDWAGEISGSIRQGIDRNSRSPVTARPSGGITLNEKKAAKADRARDVYVEFQAQKPAARAAARERPRAARRRCAARCECRRRWCRRRKRVRRTEDASALASTKVAGRLDPLCPPVASDVEHIGIDVADRGAGASARPPAPRERRYRRCRLGHRAGRKAPLRFDGCSASIMSLPDPMQARRHQIVHEVVALDATCERRRRPGLLVPRARPELNAV